MTNEELSRARNMLKCNVLTHLESRLVLFEDIGRQMLTYGRRETPEVSFSREICVPYTTLSRSVRIFLSSIYAVTVRILRDSVPGDTPVIR